MSAIDANALLTMIVFAVPFLIVAISWIMDYTGAKSNKRKREEADANFGKVVADLSAHGHCGCHIVDSAHSAHRHIPENSDFSNADFRRADLTNIRFQDVTLAGANFENAINVPPDIASALKNGFYPGTEKVTTTPTEPKKTIFFSMPGYMSKESWKWVWLP